MSVIIANGVPLLHLSQMLSPVSFADVSSLRRSASTAEDSDSALTTPELTRVASANEEWKSSEDRNLWLDTLDEDFVTSDEDQNDLENVSHGKSNGLSSLFYHPPRIQNVPETMLGN